MSNKEDLFSKGCLTAISSLVAETVTHPIDFVKTRHQVHTHSLKWTLKQHAWDVYIKNGFKGFYPSLLPAILRHWVYTSLRINIYENIRNNDDILAVKIMCAGVAGGIGQFIASPFDLIKIQSQTNTLKSLNTIEKHGIMEIIKQIYKNKGGIKGFYFGWKPNVIRAMCVNVGELTFYDTGKTFLIGNGYMNDDVYCHFVSSIYSGFWAGIISTPADVLKSRVMSGRDINMLQSLKYIANNETILSLWKGFIPNWFRLAPWQLKFWVTYEQLRILFNISTFK